MGVLRAQADGDAQRRRRVGFASLFLLGLGIRVVLLPYEGTFDMVDYADWGQRVRAHGLAQTFVQYPLVNQLFGWEISLAAALHVSVWEGLKLGTLFFDLGSFLVLVLLLRRWGASVWWALLYWLHPYFLSLFWLGYIDAPVGFFVLLGALLLSLRPTWTFTALAGVALGLALMQKPQALTVVAAVAGLLFWLLVLRRGRVGLAEARLAVVLGGVGFVFAAYSAYFHKLGYDWTHLLNGYRPSGIAKLSTGLTENMLNIWYPVANHYARRGFPLYTVDRPAVAYNIATVLVAVAFVGSAFAVAYGARRRALAISVLLVAALWTLALPMLGAHAHENHLFHGLLLTLPIVAIARERALTIAYIVLLTADGINVAVRYAFGLNHLTHWPVVGNISGFYNATRLPPLVTAYVAIAAWLIVMGLVLRIAVGRRAIAPVPESPQLSEPAASRSGAG